MRKRAYLTTDLRGAIAEWFRVGQRPAVSRDPMRGLFLFHLRKGSMRVVQFFACQVDGERVNQLSARVQRRRALALRQQKAVLLAGSVQ